MVKKNVIVVGGAMLLLFAVLSMTPQFGGFIASFESPVSCEDEPYAKNCFCSDTEERLQYKSQYYCENIEKAIDIDVPGWEIKAEQLIEAKLSKLHPDCNMATCDHENAYWQISGGVAVPSEGLIYRTVMAECISKESSQIHFARGGFLIETGDVTAFGTQCIDYYEREEGVGTIATSFVGGIPWYSGGCAGLCSYSGSPYRIDYSTNSIVIAYGWSKNCPVVGEAFSEILEYKTPYGMKILDAKGGSYDKDNVRIEILEVDGDTVRFRFRGDCGGNIGAPPLRLTLKLDTSQNCMISPWGIKTQGTVVCNKVTDVYFNKMYNMLKCENGNYELVSDDIYTSCDDSIEPTAGQKDYSALLNDELCNRRHIVEYLEYFTGTPEQLKTNLEYACNHPKDSLVIINSNTDITDLTNVVTMCRHRKGASFQNLWSFSVDFTKPAGNRNPTYGSGNLLSCFPLPS